MLHTMKIALLLLIAVVGLLQNQTTINWKNYSQMALGSMKNFPCFLCFMMGNMSNFKLSGARKKSDKWIKMKTQMKLIDKIFKIYLTALIDII